MNANEEYYALGIARQCEVGSVAEINELLYADRHWGYEPDTGTVADVLEALEWLGRIEVIESPLLCG